MPPSMLENGGDRRGYRSIQLLPSPKRNLVSVELPMQKRLQISQRKSSSAQLESRRQVKFDEVKTALLEDVPVASVMSDEEKEIRWWSDEDLDRFEEAVRLIASTIPHRPDVKSRTIPYGGLLQRIYDACQESTRDTSASVDARDVLMLSEWHRISHSKRGLEVLILQTHDHHKMVRETLVRAIKLLNMNNKIDVNTKAESIRVCSERMTNSARHIAKALGDADAACIRPKPMPRRGRSAISHHQLF